MGPEIVVLGSLNMDLVVRTRHRPAPAETVIGTDFQIIPGGKGANQAVAAARLGGKAAMVGRVGNDIFGRSLLQSLERAGVDTSHVTSVDGVATGTALIVVDEAGENSIVVVPGANGRCSVEDVRAAEDLIRSAKILMVQLEIPLATVQFALEFAKENGVTVILDPAPAQPLPSAILEHVDIITPNETEASALTNREVTDARTARLAATDFLQRGVRRAVVKLGPKGAVFAEGNCVEQVAGFAVDAVDTTAAGDSFAGGLAVALIEGYPMREAIRFANAVGALSVTRFGAQTSMPVREEVEGFLRG